MHATIRLLRAILAARKRVAVYSHRRATLDIMGEYLDACGVPYLCIDGNVKPVERKAWPQVNKLFQLFIFVGQHIHIGFAWAC